MCVIFAMFLDNYYDININIQILHGKWQTVLLKKRLQPKHFKMVYLKRLVGCNLLYFNRVPFTWQKTNKWQPLQSLKNKKCQNIKWLVHIYFLKVKCNCIHLFIFIFMLQIYRFIGTIFKIKLHICYKLCTHHLSWS